MSNAYACDVLVVGTGAAGFSAAITAAKGGLKVLVVEKAPVFGGTSAISGGDIWVPCNPLMDDENLVDDLEAARTYLRAQMGADYDSRYIESYLKHAPEMVEFLVKDVGIPFFVRTSMPDYQPGLPGAKYGRSLHAQSVDARILDKTMLERLRPLPRELSLFGMGVSSGSDLSHFYRFGRSPKSTARVATLLIKYAWDKLRYGRGRHLVNGNALIARMAKALADLRVPIWTSAPAMALLLENDHVTGARIHRNGTLVNVRAHGGVILASGGFSHDVARRARVLGVPAHAGEPVSLVAPGNVGDGVRMAEQAGGLLNDNVQNACAWMPISKVPRPDGTYGQILHSINQGKPGVLAVLRNGRRFADESLSYHDFVAHLIRQPDAGQPAGAFLICDATAFGKYGLGYAKPFLPMGKLRRAGYIRQANSVSALALDLGIDPDTLVTTITQYNAHAEHGADPQFGKGTSVYGHHLGDPANRYNPNVAPLTTAPFYAVWAYAGDIGCFAGIHTDEKARVVNTEGQPIKGLYAAGNDMRSVFAGHYPGGGSLLGPAMTFGFIAARQISEQRPTVTALPDEWPPGGP